MLLAAALVPTPPLLVPDIAGGSEGAVGELRAACHSIVSALLALEPDEVVIVGDAPCAGPVEGDWDWRGFGVAAPERAAARRLPLALAIGAWLLDSCGGSSRRLLGVPSSTSAADCAALGRALCAGPMRTALLVCGDGSACRDEKAPGFLDSRALAWDEQAVRALRDGDAAAVLALDPATARDLLAAGRAPWQVLAGAATGRRVTSRLEWTGSPYGVLYVAGSWHPA